MVEAAGHQALVAGQHDEIPPRATAVTIKVLRHGRHAVTPADAETDPAAPTQRAVERSDAVCQIDALYQRYQTAYGQR